MYLQWAGNSQRSVCLCSPVLGLKVWTTTPCLISFRELNLSTGTNYLVISYCGFLSLSQFACSIPCHWWLLFETFLFSVQKKVCSLINIASIVNIKCPCFLKSIWHWTQLFPTSTLFYFFIWHFFLLFCYYLLDCAIFSVSCKYYW